MSDQPAVTEVPRKRVLVLEDDPLHFRMVQETCGASVDLHRETNLRDAIRVAHEQKFEALLLDLHVPDSQGIATVETAARECPGLPIVVLTSVDDEELGARCVRAGAQDYLVKGRPPTRAEIELRSIRYAIERHAALAEVQAERARREQMKDEFLSHISHELRTPLSAVHQFATILLAGISGALNDAQTEYTEIIVRNSKQLAKMIEDILEVTRADTGKLRLDLRPILVPPLVQEVVQRLWNDATHKRIEVTSVVEPNLPRIYADPDRLSQVLGNLLDNAIKFTPNGGSVRLRAYRTEGEKVGFDVEDTGPGIAEADRIRIFERMHQVSDHLELSRKGLGLGLFISRELVMRQGGNIWVDPTPAGGSVFRFTVPIFDLHQILGQRVLEDGVLRPSITLITIGVNIDDHRGEGLLVDRGQRALRDLVERTVYGDRDVVLPSLNPAVTTFEVAIVASTDAVGANALAARVRANARNHDELSDLADEIEVCLVSTFDAGEEVRALPPDQIIQRVADWIDTAAVAAEKEMR
jgi:signal transduction histidine kinase